MGLMRKRASTKRRRTTCLVPGALQTGGFEHRCQRCLVVTVHAPVTDEDDRYAAAGQRIVFALSLGRILNVQLLERGAARAQVSDSLLAVAAPSGGEKTHSLCLCAAGRRRGAQF